VLLPSPPNLRKSLSAAPITANSCGGLRPSKSASVFVDRPVDRSRDDPGEAMSLALLSIVNEA
jgi:hypothetical protein